MLYGLETHIGLHCSCIIVVNLNFYVCTRHIVVYLFLHFMSSAYDHGNEINLFQDFCYQDLRLFLENSITLNVLI